MKKVTGDKKSFSLLAGNFAPVIVEPDSGRGGRSKGCEKDRRS
jgi:hypothetical protein